MIRSTKSSRIDTEALKRERPLADVIASYGVALRRESAGTYRALCPFHQERTPSFWIDARDPTTSTTGVSELWCARRRHHVRHGARGLLVPGGLRAPDHAGRPPTSEPARTSGSTARPGGAGRTGADSVEGARPRPGAAGSTRSSSGGIDGPGVPACASGAARTSRAPAARVRGWAHPAQHLRRRLRAMRPGRRSRWRSTSGWWWSARGGERRAGLSRVLLRSSDHSRAPRRPSDLVYRARDRGPAVHHLRPATSDAVGRACPAAATEIPGAAGRKASPGSGACGRARRRLSRRGTAGLARRRRLGPAGLRHLRHPLSGRTSAALSASRSPSTACSTRTAPAGAPPSASRHSSAAAGGRCGYPTASTWPSSPPWASTAARRSHPGRPCARRRLAAVSAYEVRHIRSTPVRQRCQAGDRPSRSHPLCIAKTSCARSRIWDDSASEAAVHGPGHVGRPLRRLRLDRARASCPEARGLLLEGLGRRHRRTARTECHAASEDARSCRARARGRHAAHQCRPAQLRRAPLRRAGAPMGRGDRRARCAGDRRRRRAPSFLRADRALRSSSGASPAARRRLPAGGLRPFDAATFPDRRPRPARPGRAGRRGGPPAPRRRPSPTAHLRGPRARPATRFSSGRSAARHPRRPGRPADGVARTDPAGRAGAGSADWARAYQRLALERPLDQERRARHRPIAGRCRSALLGADRPLPGRFECERPPGRAATGSARSSWRSARWRSSSAGHLHRPLAEKARAGRPAAGPGQAQPRRLPGRAAPGGLRAHLRRPDRAGRLGSIGWRPPIGRLRSRPATA